MMEKAYIMPDQRGKQRFKKVKGQKIKRSKAQKHKSTKG